ncbi:hypothetical protein BC828DRAFT_357852 [Blastocladiella britannica]|nr:hypothetical protein BC828DRAFT_357852 [Blastocladiella britannica]
MPKSPPSCTAWRMARTLVLLAVIAALSVHAHSTASDGDDLLRYELMATAPTVRVASAGAVPLHKRGADPRIHHDDRLVVSLVAFNASYQLHLTPMEHFIHPDATVLVHDGSGSAPVARPLRPLARVYSGYVVRAGDDVIGVSALAPSLGTWPGAATARFGPGDSAPLHLADVAVGTATLTLEHDGLTDHPGLAHHYPYSTKRPIFHAHFDVLGDTHTISPLHAYAAQRKDADPVVPGAHLRRRSDGHAAAAATMIIYRESDTRAQQRMRDTLNLAKRAVAASAFTNSSSVVAPPLSSSSGELCGAGLTQWNRDQRMANAARRARLFADQDAAMAAAPVLPPLGLRRRQATTTTKIGVTSTPISSPAVLALGCPSNKKFVYVGVAADCTFSAAFGNTESSVLAQILQVWATVSAKYQSTFNVGIGIQTTVIKTACGGSEKWNVDCDAAGMTIVQRLSTFSDWRGNSQKGTEGLWHLLTKCATGKTLGIAWTGTLCQTTTSTQPRSADPSTGTAAGVDSVSGTAVSSITRDLWKVVAHETGHNFGAVHDCTGDLCSQFTAAGTVTDRWSCCPCTGNCDCQGQFIMNPTDSSSSDSFSSCSATEVCSLIGKNLRTLGTSAKQCVLDPGARQSLQGNVCGNGILEPGEECDAPGSKCCTSTCKLASGAVCDDLNSPACCSQCQFKPAGTVCRAAVDVGCDIPEMCSGTNATCPTDKFIDNGTPCKLNSTTTFPNATLQETTVCSAGMCSSKSIQCFQASSGTSMQFTKSCSIPSIDCVLTCQGSDGQCYSLTQSFNDGTVCGFGGSCSAGQCVGVSPLTALSSWYNQNPTLFIIVAAVVGLLALACAYSCFKSCCCDRGRVSAAAAAARARKPSAQPAAPAAAAARQQQQQQSAAPAPLSTADRLYNEQLAFLSGTVERTRPGQETPTATPAPGGGGGQYGAPLNGPYAPPAMTAAPVPQQQQQQYQYQQPHDMYYEQQAYLESAQYHQQQQQQQHQYQQQTQFDNAYYAPPGAAYPPQPSSSATPSAPPATSFPLRNSGASSPSYGAGRSSGPRQ